VPPGFIDRFWLDNVPGERNHRCEIFALPRAEFSFGFAPCLLVVLRSPVDLDAATEREAASMLGITPAEAAVAIALAGGKEREAIAAARGSSLGTVTTQIKSLFRKLDVSREGELIALLNRLLR
jgi:DNA-binding CsgD family transcriptional regulator